MGFKESLPGMNPKKGKGWIVIGSLLLMASPVSCMADHSEAGTIMFVVGFFIFVFGRLIQD